MAMSTARMPVQNRLACGRTQREGQSPEDREPHHGDASHAVTDGSAGKGADHNTHEEGEQVELCRLHGQVELVDQIKRVVRAEAGAVHVLGEEQGHEDGHGLDDLPARQRVLARGRDGHHGSGPGARARSGGGAMARVPATDEQEHEDGDERRHREPRNARLPVWHHHKCGEQWARRQSRCCPRPGRGTGRARSVRRPPCGPRGMLRDGRSTSPSRSTWRRRGSRDTSRRGTSRGDRRG